MSEPTAVATSSLAAVAAALYANPLEKLEA